MTDTPVHYSTTIAGVKRDLRLFEIAPDVKIAILNILGDTELVQSASRDLSKMLADFRAEALITAEAKAIPLIHALSVDMGLPYVVLRKTYKPYMGDALFVAKNYPNTVIGLCWRWRHSRSPSRPRKC